MLPDGSHKHDAEECAITRGDWPATTANLQSVSQGQDTDAFIDELTEHALSGSMDASAVPALLLALTRASGTLTCAGIALALAVSAPPDDVEVLDTLVARYKSATRDDYLGAKLIDALGVYALRSPLARADLTSVLLRLRAESPWPTLIRAAKWIGRLDSLDPAPELRSCLETFLVAEDAGIQAEVHYQCGLIRLYDALCRHPETDLRDELKAAQASFLRASACDEHRPDADLFGYLTRLLLAFDNALAQPLPPAADLSDFSQTASGYLRHIGSLHWHGYNTEEETNLAVAVLRVVDALERAAAATSNVEEWTNFDAALLQIATICASARAQVEGQLTQGRIGTALNQAMQTVALPALGSRVVRTISRLQFERVIQNHVLRCGEDEVATALRSLQAAALACEYAGSEVLAPELIVRVRKLAVKSQLEPEVLLQTLLVAVERGEVGRWVEEQGLGPDALPVHRPEFYGGDPNVDYAVRRLLERLRDGLGATYPCVQWARLVLAVESITRFVHFVRDTLPNYVLCAEDSGLGQAASEADLQADLFRWLRMQFGDSAVYERQSLAGGRCDTGLHFTEVEFPIEVKHEFHHVDDEHIRAHYLKQADDYAAARARVAFLLILDLRRENAVAHRKHTPGPGSGDAKGRSLYSLAEGLSTQSLALDPDLPEARQNIVVTVLVPGNRPRPSSTTTYSERPRAARNSREKRS